MAHLTPRRDMAARFVAVHPPTRKRCKRVTKLAVDMGYIIPQKWTDTVRDFLLKPFKKRPVDFLWSK